MCVVGEHGVQTGVACSDNSGTSQSRLQTGCQFVDRRSENGTGYIECGIGKGAHIPGILQAVRGKLILYEIDIMGVSVFVSSIYLKAEKSPNRHMDYLRRVHFIPMAFALRLCQRPSTFHRDPCQCNPLCS